MDAATADGDDGTVAVGRIVRPHGVRGDLLVYSLSDHPGRFAAGARFETDPGSRSLTVASARPHKMGYIVRFAEVGDRDQAELLVKVALTIPAVDRRPLDDEEFWPDQLIGLRAETPSGVDLGEVTDVVQGAAQDRLVVTTDAGVPVEVPFVAAIVGDIDIEADRIVVDAPEGLFPEAPDPGDPGPPHEPAPGGGT
jgi:16S rRNA processing protein RimM